MNVQTVRQSLRSLNIQTLRQQPMFADKISRTATGVVIGVNAVLLVLLAIKLQRTDSPVPTHYISIVGFDQVGSWYQNARFAAFSVIVGVVNSLLAAKSFQRNRLASFFLLIGAAVVAVLCLVITAAYVW